MLSEIEVLVANAVVNVINNNQEDYLENKIRIMCEHVDKKEAQACAKELEELIRTIEMEKN